MDREKLFVEQRAEELIVEVAFLPRKKAAKYDIARQEAREVQRALRALVLKGKLTEDDIAHAMDLADHIAAMLTNMIKRLEDRF